MLSFLPHIPSQTGTQDLDKTTQVHKSSLVLKCCAQGANPGCQELLWSRGEQRAGTPTQPRDLHRAAAMPWLIHSRELFNPTAAFPVQQLAAGVTGGYYWHVPSFCNGWEHPLLLPVLLPEEGPFPMADFQSLYAFTGILHNRVGLHFLCLQCFSVPVNNWPFQARPCTQDFKMMVKLPTISFSRNSHCACISSLQTHLIWMQSIFMQKSRKGKGKARQGKAKQRKDWETFAKSIHPHNQNDLKRTF